MSEANETYQYQPNNIEIRSDVVQEIISKPPHWIISWGTTVFFFILLLLLGICCLIKYPDVVNAPFQLTSTNAPKSVQSKTDGKLVKLFVKNGREVKKGEVLAFMESTADPKEVLKLSGNLDTLLRLINNGNTDLVESYYHSQQYNNLGELQSDFQIFNQAYLQFQSYLANGFYLRKLQMLYKDIDNLKSLKENLIAQDSTAQNDYSLAVTNFNMNKVLAEKKVIAPLELRQEKSKLLSKKVPLQQLQASIISNEAAQNDKQQEIMQLENQISQQKIIFLQAINTFKSQVDAWIKQYILIAPISGTVAFSGIIQENQSFSANQELFYITPDSSQYLGEMMVPQFNLGKVKVGQKVLIKFNSYPFEQYGSVIGKVSSIANVPDKNNNYLIVINLPNGLKTHYGIILKYRNGLTASGEIITRDSRLIDKFIYNIRKSVSQ